VADDPARVRIRAEDGDSGLDRANLELRRAGEPAWQELPTVPESSGFIARLPDEDLPDGAYELRAVIVDRAGNSRLTDRFSDGQLATLGLPVRVKTRLVVGKAVRKPTRRRRMLVTEPKASYGSRLRLHGRLTMPGGNPLVEQPVAVYERIDLPGTAFSRIGGVVTSKTGRFAFRVPRGPRRVLRFRYEGTPTVQGRTTDVRLRVQAATSLRPNRRSVVNGEDVVFRGRLKGRPFPASSKLVQLQAHTRGRWSTFANPRADPKTGLWTYRYRFTATRGRVTYRIRAVVPREASYPYETGRSRPVGIRVRGL